MLENITNNEALLVRIESIHQRLDSIEGQIKDFKVEITDQVERNTEFRLKQTGVINVLKWLGFTNIIVMLGYFISRV